LTSALNDGGTLVASSGGNGNLAVELIRQLHSGDESVYPELYHQACHQFTVGEVAYAVVPHLIDIAKKAPVAQQLWPLCIAGTVAASRMAYAASSATIPHDLQDDYNVANEGALLLVTGTLSHTIWEEGQSLELTATLAAFHGHYNVAILLYLSGGSDLSCPDCGEIIEY